MLENIEYHVEKKDLGHTGCVENKPEHKPLVIMGIRQCGKTFIAKHFADKNYKNVVYMNFIKEPERMNAFTGSKDADNKKFQYSIVKQGGRRSRSTL